MADNVHFLNRSTAVRGDTSPRKTAEHDGMSAQKPIDFEHERQLRVAEETVQLTSTAKSARSTGQLARLDSGVDLDKVEMIKRAIAEGRYPIDKEAIAERMLSLSELITPLPGIER